MLAKRKQAEKEIEDIKRKRVEKQKQEEERKVSEYEAEQEKIKADREKRLAAVEARIKNNLVQPEEEKERKPDSTIMRVCNNAFDQIMNIDQQINAKQNQPLDQENDMVPVKELRSK